MTFGGAGCTVIGSTDQQAKGPGMKRTLLGMAEAGEPLLKQALEAMRAYNEAVAQGRSDAELERLRIEADHLFQTVVDYQLHKAGTLGESTH